MTIIKEKTPAPGGDWEQKKKKYSHILHGNVNVAIFKTCDIAY